MKKLASMLVLIIYCHNVYGQKSKHIKFIGLNFPATIGTMKCVGKRNIIKDIDYGGEALSYEDSLGTKCVFYFYQSDQLNLPDDVNGISTAKEFVKSIKQLEMKKDGYKTISKGIFSFPKDGKNYSITSFWYAKTIVTYAQEQVCWIYVTGYRNKFFRISLQYPSHTDEASKGIHNDSLRAFLPTLFVK